MGHIPGPVPCSLRDSGTWPSSTLQVPSVQEEANCAVFHLSKMTLSFSFPQFFRQREGLLEAENGSRPAGYFLPTTWPSHGAFHLTTSETVTTGPRQGATGQSLALNSWEASGIFWRQTGLCQQPTAWKRVNRAYGRLLLWACSLPEACGFWALIAEITAILFYYSAKQGHPSLAWVMAAPSGDPQPGLEKRWLPGPSASCGVCVSLPIKSSLCSEGRSTFPSLQLCLWLL